MVSYLMVFGLMTLLCLNVVGLALTLKHTMVLIMDKPTVDLQDIVADCEFEFWDRVATKHMPLVRSGDFDPMQAYALEQALENAIRHWWRWNGEEHYNLKDGVDILEGEE